MPIEQIAFVVYIQTHIILHMNAVLQKGTHYNVWSMRLKSSVLLLN